MLHYQGQTVQYGAKVVFDNLPKEQLRFTFDRSAWRECGIEWLHELTPDAIRLPALKLQEV